MDWEVLIPILMFAFPVIVALLDKRAKQKRAASQPTPRPRPSFPSVREIPGQARNDVRMTDAAAGGVAPGNPATLGTVRGGTASEAQRWGPTKEDVFGGKPRRSPEDQSEEGVRAIKKREEKSPQRQEPADKLKIDKKKLILYSEILKPKYDD